MFYLTSSCSRGLRFMPVMLFVNFTVWVFQCVRSSRDDLFFKPNELNKLSRKFDNYCNTSFILRKVNLCLVIESLHVECLYIQKNLTSLQIALYLSLTCFFSDKVCLICA